MTVTKPEIIVVHTEDGLRPQVLDAIALEGYVPTTMLTSARDPFAYACVLRGLWQLDCEFVHVEQDVVPPPGAIAQLLACPGWWCSHRHWVGDHYVDTTTGLVRWRLELRRRHPWLMDLVCAAPDPRYWVRRGWTNLPRDCSVATLNGPGRRACLRPDAPAHAAGGDPRLRPTTHDWRGIDSDLASKLVALGHPVHVHEPPTLHLHDYERDPLVPMRRWWDEPYSPEAWPD